MPAINDATQIKSNLKGTTQDRQRRSALVVELLQAIAGGGPEAVSRKLTHRLDTLAGAFDDQLAELKKQL